MKYCLPLVMFFLAACSNIEKRYPSRASSPKDSLVKAIGETVIAGDEDIKTEKTERLVKRSKIKMKKKTHLTSQQNALDSVLILNR